MELLCTVSIESIEEIIEKKRSKIRSIESDPLKARNNIEKINKLNREIQLLYMEEYKLKKIYEFVQQLDA